MAKAQPFYHDVDCRKILGGKRTLWQARKPGFSLTGAGNSADNAIKDLQTQINRIAAKAYNIYGQTPTTKEFVVQAQADADSVPTLRAPSTLN